jgi:hypothetical protein
MKLMRLRLRNANICHILNKYGILALEDLTMPASARHSFLLFLLFIACRKLIRTKDNKINNAK